MIIVLAMMLQLGGCAAAESVPADTATAAEGTASLPERESTADRTENSVPETSEDRNESSVQETPAPEVTETGEGTDTAPSQTGSATQTERPADTESTPPGETKEAEPAALPPRYDPWGKQPADDRDPADRRPAMQLPFRPHVLSALLADHFGEAFTQDFYDYCDAVLAGADGFVCREPERWYLISDLARVYFPLGELAQPNPAPADAADRPDGWIALNYALPREDFLREAERFQTRIAFLLANADLREGDSDLEIALKLYTSESLRIAYDYAADEGEPEGFALSPYRALTGDTGICQEIAGAYAYLLMQAGVEAVTCGTLARDASFAHEWTLVRLNGTYYHADVTWQLDAPSGLRHFGETDAGREADNLDIEYLNIGEINEIWHRDLPMEDETFAPLWPASRYRIEHEAGRILCLDEADPEDAAGAEDFRTARVFVMPEEADDQKRIAETPGA